MRLLSFWVAESSVGVNADLKFHAILTCCRTLGTSSRGTCAFDPSPRASPTLSLSNGRLLAIGAGREAKGPAGATVWQAELPTSLDWERERLLWLACFKNSRAECHLANCPPHVIYKIIGYVNCNTFYISNK